jgi:hypothetical protein
VLVAVGLGALAWAALATALEGASPILTFTYLPVILLSRVWTNHSGR